MQCQLSDTLSHEIFQESKGYEFESETDTETIAKLIKYVFDNRETEDITFSTLVERVIQQLVSYRSHLCKYINPAFPHSSGLCLKPLHFGELERPLEAWGR